MSINRKISPVDRLYRETDASLYTQHVAATSRRDAVIELVQMRMGLIDDERALQKFNDSLLVQKIDDLKDPSFSEVYEVYLQNFPIKEEQESKSGFKTVLAYNKNAQMRQQYGAFEEKWICVRDPHTRQVIGGINFSTYDMSDDPQTSAHVDGTQHLTYLFVSPEYRRLGIARKLVALAKNDSLEFLSQCHPDGKKPSAIKMASFNEQNQPRKMSLYNYFYDTKNSMIDQCDRLKWWSKRGYSPLKFHYVQPALEQGGEPCTDLALNANFAGKSVPSTVIIKHLEKFFSLSVLKNKDARGDIHFTAMEDKLKRMDIVGYEASEDYTSLKAGVWELMRRQGQSQLRTIKERAIGDYMPKESGSMPLPSHHGQTRTPAFAQTLPTVK